MDNFEHKSDNELDNSQHIDGMNSNTRFPQKNEIIRSMESNMSTNVFMNMNIGVTVRHTSLQSLFLRHLYRGISTSVSLQLSLPVSLLNETLRHLYRGISTVMSLHPFILTSLRNEFLQSSLLTYLRSEFL